MSRVISLRLQNKKAMKLERLARSWGRSVGTTAGLLLDEKLKEEDRKSTRLNSSHIQKSRMPSSA